MDVNIDRGTIGFFRIGDKFESSKGPINGPGYSVYIKDAVVVGFLIRFREVMETEESRLICDGKFYKYHSRTPSIVFRDQIIKNSEVIKIDKDSKPNHIASIFEVKCEYWDDDVCLGMSFVLDNLEYEFSWSWVSENDFQLDYLHIELCRKQIS